MSKSQIYFHIALFFMAFSVFIFNKRSDLLARQPHSGAIATIAPEHLLPKLVQLAFREGDAPMPARNPAGQSVASAIAEQESQQALEFSQNLQQASAEAIANVDVDARAAAVQQLSGTRTPEAVNALSQAALHDQEMRIRYMAVDSLKLLALNQGDADGTVRSLLRLAMNDRDGDVARHARDSLQELHESITE